jgi:hypothetical protein
MLLSLSQLLPKTQKNTINIFAKFAQNHHNKKTIKTNQTNNKTKLKQKNSKN